MGIFYSPSWCVHLFVLNVTLVLQFGISAATPQPHDRELSKVALTQGNILTLEQHRSINKICGIVLECILVHFLTVGCKSLIFASQDLL